MYTYLCTKDARGGIVCKKTEAFEKTPLLHWISSEILVKRLWQIICLQWIHYSICLEGQALLKYQLTNYKAKCLQLNFNSIIHWIQMKLFLNKNDCKGERYIYLKYFGAVSKDAIFI